MQLVETKKPDNNNENAGNNSKDKTNDGDRERSDLNTNYSSVTTGRQQLSLSNGRVTPYVKTTTGQDTVAEMKTVSDKEKQELSKLNESTGRDGSVIRDQEPPKSGVLATTSGSEINNNWKALTILVGTLAALQLLFIIFLRRKKKEESEQINDK